MCKLYLYCITLYTKKKLSTLGSRHQIKNVVLYFSISLRILLPSLVFCAHYAMAQSYYIPGEDFQHEGTWLQWPHNDLYGPYYQSDVEATWVSMTKALQSSEKVHIIAKDTLHQQYIIRMLSNAENIDFHIHPTNDVWVRDNGPFFVYNQQDSLHILDWKFNGWGGDVPYAKCDRIPTLISAAIQVPKIDIEMVLEGGAVEHDGRGTAMLTKSSTTHTNRNPNITEEQIEGYLKKYLGFKKVIWLDGVAGKDITDMHIDGFVKFANDSTLVTMSRDDLRYWLLTKKEIDTIYHATNLKGEKYQLIQLPLTKRVVKTTHGKKLKVKGSYCNYYIANTTVLVPIYNDPNDKVALEIIQALYPNRKVIGINVQNLYEYGGMIHCITQQQPIEIFKVDKFNKE